MPEQNPSCCSISRSNVVRIRRRCASRSLFCDSSSFSRSSSSCFDRADRALHRLGAGDVVGCREDRHRLEPLHHIAGERMQHVERLDLVAEQLDADGVLLVDRDDLDRVAAHPEVAAREVDVVAVVLHRDELADERVAVVDLAHLQRDHRPQVLLGRAETVDARDRAHHDDIAPAQQRVRRRVTQSLDLGVDRGVLLDEGVGLRDVRLGLVVVVVADEVLDRVVRHELAELVRQLRRERLVVREHERRALHLLDEPCRRRRLAGAGGAQQHDVGLTRVDAGGEVGDRLRLVAGRLVFADDLEGAYGTSGLHLSRVGGPTDTRAMFAGGGCRQSAPTALSRRPVEAAAAEARPVEAARRTRRR